MIGINWNQFGLKRNPYDTEPLTESGDINVGNAFVGREKESELIAGMFASEERVCFTICGDAGVGKTSIANYQKYYWKQQKNKRLFSFRSEIEASEHLLNKKHFMLEIIGAFIREIELVEPKLIQRNTFLQRMQKLVDLTQSLGISASVGTGFAGIVNLQANFAEKEIAHPFYLTTVTLEKYIDALLTFVRNTKINKKHYEGIIIHVNNFDVVMQTHKKQTLQFFAEIRDFLQTKHLYFLFLGPTDFYQEIIASQSRVKSIFVQYPLLLEPLTKEELITIFNKRLTLLQLEDVADIIKPFDDAVIGAFYDMFEGDIRMVMAALRDALTVFPDSFPKQITLDEAMVLLAGERMARVEKQLTEDKLRVLEAIIVNNEPVTQVMIAKALNKQQTNISSYFKVLARLGVIEVKKEEGRMKYWYFTTDYLPLSQLHISQKRLREHLQYKHSS